MGKGIEENQIFQEIRFEKSCQLDRVQWVMAEVKAHDIDEYESGFVEKCSDDFSDSIESFSSSELADDATSSSSSSVLTSQDGPLYELSELMTHLPIKRGLSKYYQGKSESFGSLANLKSFEDLAKKGITQRSRSMKTAYRRHGQGQSQQKLGPKGTIVKNKKSCSSSMARSSLFFLQ